MNDSDLENELRALPPAAPSAALESRIAADLAALSANAVQRAEPARESVLARILQPLFWASAGAAAAVAAMTFLASPPTEVPQLAATSPGDDAGDLSSPETTRELLGTEQGEVRYEAGQGPVREVRASYLEHHAWTDPRTGGRVEIAVPREDVFLQPIAMQ